MLQRAQCYKAALVIVTHLVRSVHVRAGASQRPDELRMAVKGGSVQGCTTVLCTSMSGMLV